MTRADRVLALSQLWAEARFSFGYFDRVANDWDRLYEEFLPRVEAAPTDYQYYLELMRFYAHLNDGHSGVFWPAAFNEALGYPPVEIRKIDGRAVVLRLLTETPELKEHRIRPGLTITAIDGRPVADLVNEWRQLKTGSTEQATNRLAYFRILTGPRNSTVEVRVEEPDGTVRTERLTRSEKYFNDTNLTPPQPYVAREAVDGIGYFQANQMSQPVADALGEYVDRAGSLRGLILDFRYNGGGSDVTGFQMISRLIDQPLDGPVYEVTAYRADRRAVRQEQEIVRDTAPPIEPATKPRFTGWVAVLVGEQTHSAAEGGFLSVIRPRPRTIFVGEQTAGSTGQPLVFSLPDGARGAVCSRRTLKPDGHSFVGTGFAPDVPASLTRDDLWTGRDRVIEIATAELRQRLRQSSTR